YFSHGNVPSGRALFGQEFETWMASRVPDSCCERYQAIVFSIPSSKPTCGLHPSSSRAFEESPTLLGMSTLRASEFHRTFVVVPLILITVLTISRTDRSIPLLKW